MKLFREVKASERLPDIQDRHYLTNTGLHELHRGMWVVENPHHVKYWLEPIEITEEDVEEIIENHAGTLKQYVGLAMSRESCRGFFVGFYNEIMGRLK